MSQQCYCLHNPASDTQGSLRVTLLRQNNEQRFSKLINKVVDVVFNFSIKVLF